MESIAARAARLGRADGFDALRLAPAIFAFHGFTLTHGRRGSCEARRCRLCS